MTNLQESILHESVKEFNEAIDQIIQFLEENDKSKYYIQPSAEEWSVMQVVAHVIEAIEFWTNDVRDLLIVSTGKWGRNHEHVGRLAAVEPKVVQQLDLNEAISELKQLKRKVGKVLSNVAEENLSVVAPSYNPNFDQKRLSFIIDTLIVEHAKGHYGQIVRHYNKVK